MFSCLEKIIKTLKVYILFSNLKSSSALLPSLGEPDITFYTLSSPGPRKTSDEGLTVRLGEISLLIGKEIKS